jgi:cytoskeleton protein RodZ
MLEGDTEVPQLSPGAWLAAAREQAGLSLVQTAERLHVDVATIKALEGDHFEALGAAVYARGHMRRYAELLGLPIHEVESAYARVHPSAQLPDLTRTAGSRDSTARALVLRPWTAAVGAAILVLLGLVLWAMRMPHKAPVASPASITAPADAAPQPLNPRRP